MVAQSVLGRRVKRVDGPEKVTGQARFGADLSPPGLFHARLVVSPHAHARILSIDASRALELPGVVAVATAGDLAPHVKGAPTSRAKELLARDVVRFCGQPVAAVLAESEAAAEDALADVLVEYEGLPALLDPVAAMRTEAPAIWPDGLPGREAGAEAEPPNVGAAERHERGDVESALREADVVIEQTFRTAPVHQGYVEPHVATASLDPVGNLTVWTAAHGIFLPRQTIAQVLGWPEHRIRVVPLTLGGGFGGKGVLLQPLAAALAVAYRRPVRVVLTRMDEFLAATPAPAATVELKLGARRDGTLTTLDARIVFNLGPYSGGPLTNASLYLGAFYRIPNLRICGYAVATHTIPQGSYRAPGGPQSMFAVESAMDELARTLDLDPIELRLKNVAEEGDPLPNGKPWPRIGLRQCLERLREHPAWQDRARWRANGQGVGVAIAGLFGGLQPAGALCRLETDGTLSVVVGSVDVSGTYTGLAMLAADAFGIPAERVRVVGGDTDSAPFSGMAGGSKITLTTGAAIVEAARDARRQLLAIAADQLEASPDDLDVEDGRAVVRGAPDRAIGLERLATLSTEMAGAYPPVFGRGSTAITQRAPGTVAHLARVRVDPETGEPRVVGYVAVQDVGCAVNPAGIEDQIHGGVAQGIGWALYEGIVLDEGGRVLTGSLLDYAIPSAGMVPPIETIILEVPSQSGPCGVRGVGEPPVIPVAAAVANAIRDATGARLTELPIRAERLHRALTARQP